MRKKDFLSGEKVKDIGELIASPWFFTHVVNNPNFKKQATKRLNGSTSGALAQLVALHEDMLIAMLHDARSR